MAQRRRNRAAARKRRNAGLAGGTLLLVLLVALLSAVWPYLLGVVAVAGVGTGAWRLWRAGRFHREADQRWRREDAVQAGHRTLAEVDTMSGTEFEDHVAALCRRDGCTDVRRVGGAGDHGADVLGRLPDGRTLIVQCKRYATTRSIAARDPGSLRSDLVSGFVRPVRGR
jgi:restriction system protein